MFPKLHFSQSERLEFVRLDNSGIILTIVAKRLNNQETPMSIFPDGNRLDQIEKILENLVATAAQNSQQIKASIRQIETNAKQIEANSRDIAELRSAVASLVKIVEVHQTNFEVTVAEIERMAEEIRGLRTENLRIQQRLFGQERNEDQNA